MAHRDERRAGCHKLAKEIYLQLEQACRLRDFSSLPDGLREYARQRLKQEMPSLQADLASADHNASAAHLAATSQHCEPPQDTRAQCQRSNRLREISDKPHDATRWFNNTTFQCIVSQDLNEKLLRLPWTVPHWHQPSDTLQHICQFARSGDHAILHALRQICDQEDQEEGYPLTSLPYHGTPSPARSSRVLPRVQE